MEKNKIKLFLILISVIFAYLIASNIKLDSDFSNFALGEGTKTVLAKDNDNNIIHINTLNNEGFDNLKNTWVNNSSKQVILILGNSQTHSINNLKKNETNFVEQLNKNSENYQILCVSYPNASIQDFLITYEYLDNFFPINQLIIPFFFDDMREKNGIKSLFFNKISNEKYKFKNQGLFLNFNNQFSSLEVNEEESYHRYKSTQEIANDFLESQLSNRSNSLWSKKEKLQSWIFSQMYLLRNTLFGINPRTERSKINNRYIENMEAFRLIVKKSHKDNVSIIGYIPPIRNDVRLPYNMGDYNTFIDEVEIILNEHKNNNIFLNLSEVVPSESFGLKSSTSFDGEFELDFMHFTY